MNPNECKRGLTRRDFLVFSALTAASGVLAACGSPNRPDSKQLGSGNGVEPSMPGQNQSVPDKSSKPDQVPVPEEIQARSLKDWMQAPGIVATQIPDVKYNGSYVVDVVAGAHYMVVEEVARYMDGMENMVSTQSVNAVYRTEPTLKSNLEHDGINDGILEAGLVAYTGLSSYAKMMEHMNQREKDDAATCSKDKEKGIAGHKKALALWAVASAVGLAGGAALKASVEGQAYIDSRDEGSLRSIVGTQIEAVWYLIKVDKLQLVNKLREMGLSLNDLGMQNLAEEGGHMFERVMFKVGSGEPSGSMFYLSKAGLERTREVIRVAEENGVNSVWDKGSQLLLLNMVARNLMKKFFGSSVSKLCKDIKNDNDLLKLDEDVIEVPVVPVDVPQKYDNFKQAFQAPKIQNSPLLLVH